MPVPTAVSTNKVRVPACIDSQYSTPSTLINASTCLSRFQILNAVNSFPTASFQASVCHESIRSAVTIEDGRQCLDVDTNVGQIGSNECRRESLSTPKPALRGQENVSLKAMPFVVKRQHSIRHTSSGGRDSFDKLLVRVADLQSFNDNKCLQIRGRRGMARK